jgi:transketolase
MLKDLIHLRQEIITVSYINKAGHIPSAFSILEILFSLYNGSMEQEDKFLLSKGHGCLALYSMLYYKGHITKEQLYSFSQYDSILGGHPDRNKLPQIEISAGSLGHGLPIAAGISLSRKIKNQNGRVFCLVGDGECNEGTTWETLLLADRLKLNNLVCIVDNNSSQTRSVPTVNIKEKFISFGFDTIECDGHNLTELSNSLNYRSEKPVAIICNTVKGYGISEMENDMFSWHHGAPNQEKYKAFMQELENK